MNPTLFRVFGLVLLLAAVVIAILNLHRVAGLGVPWMPPLFIVFGAVFVGLAASAAKRQRG